MEDFNALAAALGADVVGVRACLILSRDGLIIGAHPGDAEATAKPAWLRLANLGDPERGFLQFGTETWCYVRRGPYSAFVVAGPGVRPGLVIDQMERALLAAEEARADRGSLKGDAAVTAAAAPASRPRTQLHREPKPDEPIVIHEPDVAAPARAAPGAVSASSSPTNDATGTAGDDDAAERPEERGAQGAATARRPAARSMWATEGEDEDVDRFSLAREFGQLLQDGETGADG